MAHADLPDADLVACRCLENRLRQSDVIVEIALRFCDAKRCARTDAVKSLVLVLPLLPVMATTLMPNERR
jgi:hypothetical protein